MLQKTSIAFTCSRINCQRNTKTCSPRRCQVNAQEHQLVFIATVTEREQSMHPVDPLHLQASPSGNDSQRDKIISYKINLKKLETGTKIS